MKTRLINGILIWLPRALAILFVILLASLSFDVFEGNESIWNMLLGFLIHLIPALVVLGLLILSWKFKLTGGILFMTGGILFIVLIAAFTLRDGTYRDVNVTAFNPIPVPLIVIGILFIVSHFVDKSLHTAA